MIINLGSNNKVKREAVEAVLARYDLFWTASIVTFSVDSAVSEQPMTLTETVAGARNRAVAAYNTECAFSIGIEGGLCEVPFTRTGYMNIEAASIYNGQEHFLGLSPGFEHPDAVVEALHSQDIDLSEAYRALKLTNSQKIGEEGGSISLLTGGRETRKGYLEQALIMALIHVKEAS